MRLGERRGEGEREWDRTQGLVSLGVGGGEASGEWQPFWGQEARSFLILTRGGSRDELGGDQEWSECSAKF